MNSLNKYDLTTIPGIKDLIMNKDCEKSNYIKLNKVECRTSNNNDYKIIRYDKNFLSCDLISTYGLCRSIIINDKNKIIGFAPPKSVPCENFLTKYSENTNGVIAEEFIEGTMINVFWDENLGIWEIATRNTIGATSTFYKGPRAKSFRNMFFEAAKECNLKLENLEKEYCYSFVLQHPENRIVVHFYESTLYLVAIYKISHTENNIQVENLSIDRIKFNQNHNTKIKFPILYTFNKYSELIEKYASMNTNYDIVGVVIHNHNTGERCKIRNPVYEQVRNLRGNQPKLQYQYLALRSEGKISDFLKYFPENKNDFSTFRDQVHLFTETLHSNYISCYVKKEKSIMDFSLQYKNHIIQLHKKYMDELREKKLFINNTIVKNYVNNLHPSYLMFSINYPLRKNYIDTNNIINIL